MSRPTPETDAARITEKNGCIATFGVSQVVAVNFARRLERERDDAREDLQEIKEYGTEEINAAVSLRQKLASALVERDEARQQIDQYRDKLDLTQ
jgi:hypothetical protein